MSYKHPVPGSSPGRPMTKQTRGLVSTEKAYENKNLRDALREAIEYPCDSTMHELAGILVSLDYATAPRNKLKEGLQSWLISWEDEIEILREDPMSNKFMPSETRSIVSTMESAIRRIKNLLGDGL